MRKVHGRELKRSFGCTLGIPALPQNVCVCVCVCVLVKGACGKETRGEWRNSWGANEITLERCQRFLALLQMSSSPTARAECETVAWHNRGGGML